MNTETIQTTVYESEGEPWENFPSANELQQKTSLLL